MRRPPPPTPSPSCSSISVLVCRLDASTPQDAFDWKNCLTWLLIPPGRKITHFWMRAKVQICLTSKLFNLKSFIFIQLLSVIKSRIDLYGKNSRYIQVQSITYAKRAYMGWPWLKLTSFFKATFRTKSDDVIKMSYDVFSTSTGTLHNAENQKSHECSILPIINYHITGPACQAGDVKQITYN